MGLKNDALWDTSDEKNDPLIHFQKNDMPLFYVKKSLNAPLPATLIHHPGYFKIVTLY